MIWSTVTCPLTLKDLIKKENEVECLYYWTSRYKEWNFLNWTDVSQKILYSSVKWHSCFITQYKASVTMLELGQTVVVFCLFSTKVSSGIAPGLTASCPTNCPNHPLWPAFRRERLVLCRISGCLSGVNELLIVWVSFSCMFSLHSLSPFAHVITPSSLWQDNLHTE